MTTFLLIRHAVNDYVKTGKLAGRLPGIHLNAMGQRQAAALGERLASAPLDCVYASPMERTMETAAAIVKHHPGLQTQAHEGINEVRYGAWRGAAISDLARRKMWQVVQEYPSRAVFPDGESLRDAQNRIVDAVEALAKAHPAQMIALVCHADLIKLALAHYLGMHLDVFQRIVIAPASISVLHLRHSRPLVMGMNDIAHLAALRDAESAESQPAASN